MEQRKQILVSCTLLLYGLCRIHCKFRTHGAVPRPLPAEIIALENIKRTTNHSRAVNILDALGTMYDELKTSREPTVYTCEDYRWLVRPVSFSIPAEYIVGHVPPKQKVRSSVIPGMRSTYKFKPTKQHALAKEVEADYYKDMKESLFCLTFKKSGWDCLRHLEILAAGCLPLFTDIELTPRKSLSSYPKRVFQALLQFPALQLQGKQWGDSFDLSFNMSKSWDTHLYGIAVQMLLTYTRQVLTTEMMARFVLEQVGPLPSKILFINSKGYHRGDYMGDTLLHGLIQLLGQEKVVDYPHRDVIFYTADHLPSNAFYMHKHRSYGYGFSYAATLFELPDVVDRTNLSERVRAHEFDLVLIYQVNDHSTQVPLLDEVCRHMSRRKVVIVYGDDQPIACNSIREFQSCAGHIFSREM